MSATVLERTMAADESVLVTLTLAGQLCGIIRCVPGGPRGLPKMA